jgi:Ca2+-binding EF-hand superfamily protein
MAELMRRFDVNENGKISLFELADILTYWEEMSRKSRGTGHGTWKKSPRTAL